MPTSIPARIHLGDGSTIHPVSITHVGGDLYRVHDFPDPFTEEFNHLDLIRLQQEPDGSFEFSGVVTPSGWHRYQYMLPKRGSLPELLEPVFRQADAQGGTAVLDFGGCLQVFLPPECTWEPSGAIDAAMRGPRV
jgi:hypothetical protein